jgi:hypothetical protein
MVPCCVRVKAILYVVCPLFWPYYRASGWRFVTCQQQTTSISPLILNLNSPQRRLIALRMEHGDLDALIDQASDQRPVDELMMRRLKKRRLALRDEMARVEQELTPDEPA